MAGVEPASNKPLKTHLQEYSNLNFHRNRKKLDKTEGGKALLFQPEAGAGRRSILINDTLA